MESLFCVSLNIIYLLSFCPSVVNHENWIRDVPLSVTGNHEIPRTGDYLLSERCKMCRV